MKGQGIAKKDFKTIFEPFRQTGAETEAVYGGTGLGLPITAKLV
jgi:signal transduction histidine kinase